MKGEYFMMKKHGLRRFFSLLLAVFMVCTLLPTAALAEDTTEADETQSQTVVVDEKKPDPPAQEQPEDEDPPAPEQDKDETPTPEPVGEKTVGENVANEGDAPKKSDGNKNPPMSVESSHTVKVNFAVLYIDDSFSLGYNYKTYEYNKELVCQGSYCRPNGFNHSINISDIKEAAGRASIDTGYKITGWAKDAKPNPTIWSLDTPGTTYVSKSGYYIYIVAKKPAPAKPAKPSNNDVENLLGDAAVKVNCATLNSGHTAVTYPLLDNSFTVGDVQGSSGNYTCVVTVTADSYVTAYGGGHRLAAANESPKTITLKYNETAKTWAAYTVTPIVFNVVCNTAPAQPTAPSDNDVKALLGENAVQIICTNTQIGHDSKTFVLIDDTFTVRPNNNRYEVVITDFNPYVSAFNNAVNVSAGTHIADPSKEGQNQKIINLVWRDGNWTAIDAPAKYHVMCNAQPMPDKPATPGEGDLKNIEKLVRIVCDRNIHEAKEYGVIAGSCEFGDINMTGNVPTCPVTIRAAKYVETYNDTIGVEHTITGDTERPLLLAWDANNNVWRPMTDTPVTFTVICPPAKPGAEDLAKLEKPVEVVCTTKPETHAAKRFPLINETYNIGDVSGNETDGYFCNITVTADEYVTKYITEFGKNTLTGDNTKPLKLKYVEGQWAVDDPVVFQVSCVPDAPADNYLKDLLNREVTVTCTTNAAHAPAEYGLLDSSYQGSGVQPDGKGGYTYTVTIAAAEYVKKYNTDRQRNHSLVKDEPAEKSVTLVWNAGKRDWRFADANAVPVNFNVKCLYTVTYKDGADGSVFKTVSFPDLKKGEATPTIDDPIRVGYKFAGWEPTVAATVTKDETYIAQWKKVDTTFTVKYNDNVKGKAFKEQVHEDLKYNEETPTFNGTPKRSGYTFTGWKPVVTDRVTEDVVYYAQWKSNSGKDRVPKTGDGQIVMILGSVLLFSFCGATAVYLNDRKRKQG